jgi:hypothetical protein
VAKSFALVDGELYKRAASGILAVRTHPRGARAPTGYSRGDLWPSRRTPHPHGQCVPSRLLLAHGGRRRQRDRAHLRRVPILRLKIQPPSSRPADHPHNMALRCVGTGHCRAPAEGAPGLHPLVGRNRQISQVGGGAPHYQSQG